MTASVKVESATEEHENVTASIDDEKKPSKSSSCTTKKKKVKRLTTSKKSDIKGSISRKIDVKPSISRKIKHKKRKKKTSYVCLHCHKVYTRLFSLKRHLASTHGEMQTITFDTYPCTFCPKVFDLKYNLRRHLATMHTEESTDAVKDYYCTDEPYFECAICERRFRRKDSLQAHLFRKHIQSRDEGYTHACAHCPRTFREKYAIKRHILHTHNPEKHSDRIAHKDTEFRCLECGDTFCTKRSIGDHYRDTHNVLFEFEEHNFESWDEFKEWKLRIQRQTITQFRLTNSWKASTHTVKQLRCHRSGKYQEQTKDEKRKRLLKAYGSKKLQGFCPAEMSVKIGDDGRCFLTYQKTHVGHSACDLSELCHIYLEKDEKEEIVAEMVNGSTPNEIIQKKNSSAVPEEGGNRLAFLNRRDFDNIRKSLGWKNYQSRGFGSEPVKVDPFFTENQDAILYYKDETQEDTAYEIFDKNDFVVVVMDEQQETNLKRYGHKVISFDCAYGSNPCDYVLHTMLVLDMDCEGVPVAFVLSNRNDDRVIDFFLRCIKDRVGVIRPKTLIEDLQNTYYDRWVEIMQPPEYHLFCSWYVREEWRRALSKIQDKTKKETVREKLFNLANELDPVVFESNLEKFVEIDDEDLQPFVTFFKENYLRHTQCWAYCFRKFAGVNTNMHFKVFHNTLKRNIGEGKKIKSLFEMLCFVREYFTFKEMDNRTKRFRGKTTNKLAMLRKRHRAAEKQKDEKPFVIGGIDEQSWLVGLFEAEENTLSEMYTVNKVEDKECTMYEDVYCQLSCTLCNICFHEYRCTCQDSAICNNMCIHIHTLGIFLQSQVNVTEDGPSEVNEICEIAKFEHIDHIQCDDNDDDEVEYANEENLDSMKQNVRLEFEQAMKMAQTTEDMEEIRNQYITPIKGMLQAKYQNFIFITAGAEENSMEGLVET